MAHPAPGMARKGSATCMTDHPILACSQGSTAGLMRTASSCAALAQQCIKPCGERARPLGHEGGTLGLLGLLLLLGCSLLGPLQRFRSLLGHLAVAERLVVRPAPPQLAVTLTAPCNDLGSQSDWKIHCTKASLRLL